MFSTLLFSVAVGRWMYAEIGLIMPGALPALDYVLQATSIPTHDKWPKDSMDQLVTAVSSAITTDTVDSSSRRIQEAMLQAPKQVSGFTQTSASIPSWRSKLSELSAMLDTDPAQAPDSYYPIFRKS